MSFASKDSDTHRYHPSRWSPEQLERQKSIWKKEQGLIASLVEVHEDPTPNSRDGTNIIAEDRPWFRRVLPLHAELDSSSPSPGTDAESCDNNPTNGDDDDKDDDERRYYYGGVDVSFPNPNTAIRRAKSGGAGAIPSPSLSVAVYVVLDSRTLEVVYRDHEWYDAEAVPYVPTFLAVREIDPLETLVRRQLSEAPDRTPRAILVDGNGSFHPRGAGIACCLGVRTGLPTIGIGKSLLNVPLPLPSEEENGPHPDRTADEEPAEPLTTGKDNENGDAAAVSDQHRDENGDATDNHCWTRELLDARIDDFLERVHGAFFGGNGNDNGNGNGNGNENNRDGRDSAAPWAPQESPGLILGKPAPTAPRHRQKLATGKHRKERIDRKDLLKDLAPVCNGIAIPLECRSATTTTTTGSCGNRSNNNCNTADDANGNNSVILGTALVGHGGLGRHGTKPTTATKSKSNPKTKPRKDPGTAKPIVVSVGHGMSLLEATRIAASLSRVRIPEPVRIADLRGRELIREREEEDARKKRAGVGA